MICWGEGNCCAVFLDREIDKCDCLRDFCVRDYAPEVRIMVKESELDDVIDTLYIGFQDHLVELDRMLSIKNITNSIDHVSETKQFLQRLAQRFIEMEFDVDIAEIGPEEQKEYVLFANYFSTPAKNVVLVYAQVDVPAVDENDGWTHNPYQLTQDVDDLYGIGLTSSKGPVLCWLHAADAWLKETADLPVNLRFIITSNSISNINSLRHLIMQRQTFLKAVDLLITNTNHWITPRVAMLTPNHSGYIYFELEVRQIRQRRKKSDKTLPPYLQPMIVLCLLMNSLTDTTNGVKVKGLDRHVMPITQRDFDILTIAEADIIGYKERTGATGVLHEKNQQEFLKYQWCMPGISIHGVAPSLGSVSERDMLLPNRVAAKFSVKLVPDQSVDYVIYCVRDHLEKAYLGLNCRTPVFMRVVDKLKPINEAKNAPFTLSAQRAYERVYHSLDIVVPDTISVCHPILNELRQYCMENAQVLGLPFSSIHMKPNQANESMSQDDFQKCQELCATLLFEVALIPADCKCAVIKDFCYEHGRSTDRDFIRMLQPLHPNLADVLYELSESELTKGPETNESKLGDFREILLGASRDKKALR